MIEGNRKCRESMLSPTAPSIKLYRNYGEGGGFYLFHYRFTGLQVECR